MANSLPFTDIHCHVLPGLDDGAGDVAEALAMAEMAVAQGIGTIVATPHQLGTHAANSGQAIREAVARFQSVLDSRRIPLRVVPGADVRIDPDLTRKIRTGEVVTPADRRRHVLLELPHDVYVSLAPLLADLRSAGLVGILSHPERNRGLLRRPELVAPLVRQGCLMQVTAASITGEFGSRVRQFAESLVADGVVHFVATDAHGVRTRPPLLRPAFERVAELAGQETAIDLCCRNPAAVVRGERIEPRCCKAAKSAWPSWFRKTFSLEPASVAPI
jgi:protein-tyrosine phosphatase